MTQVRDDVKISVLICTYNRAQSLERTLSAITAQALSVASDVVVVNDGSTDDTDRILSEAASSMPLRVMRMDHQGKARCLNAGIGLLRGSLIVFTDDDIIPSAQWLSELYRASLEHSEASVFCGPISPSLPVGTPHWLRNSRYAMVAGFAEFKPLLEEGILPAPKVPFGGNFAVRKEILRDLKVREDLGPGSSGSQMGEDTELLRRIRSMRHSFIYVPTAEVKHTVRPEQIETVWLRERAFNMGRTVIAETKTIDDISKKVCGNIRETSSVQERFEHEMLYNYCLGQLYQLAQTQNIERFREMGALITSVFRHPLQSL